MTKTCKRCGVSKDSTEFYAEPRVADGLTAICRKCNGVLSKQWAKNNRAQYNKTQQRWRERHPETALEKGRAWRANNRKRSNEFSRKWARANPERIRARQLRWAKENQARIALYAQERRAREAGASGSTTPAQLQARIDYYGNACWVCQAPYEAIDHVFSLKQGGTNWPANLRPICKACNSAKGSKHPLTFLETRASSCA